MTTPQRAATIGGIGASVLRHEDPPLLTGQARYIADIHLPRQLTMAIVRSPVANGAVLGIDTAEAVALPGVEAVFTADDLVESVGRMPRIPPRVSFDETVLPYLQPILAGPRVRYTGEPLAVVVAGEQLFEAGNLVTTLHAEFGDVERAFPEAETVVEKELTIGRHSGVPMETRGIAVEFATAGESFIVYGATKVPHWNLRTTAELLGMPPSPSTDARDRGGRWIPGSGPALSGGCAGGLGGRSPPAFGGMDRGPPRAPVDGQSLARAEPHGADRG